MAVDYGASRSAGPHRAFAVALAFILPLSFALFTNHVWEDYYITFRASKNLAEGNGLVYQVGERVHSFTSPLGVLLPALFYYVTGSDTASLWCFRVLSCAAVAGAVSLLWKTLERHRTPLLGRWLVTLALLADSKLLDFSINGMETAGMVFFAAMLLHSMFQAVPKALPLGVAFAGLMWTRPDGFVVAAAIVVAAVVFVHRARSKLADTARTLLGGAGWAALFYGPWVAWAYWYYGSPIPNTILAKSGGRPELGPLYLVSAPWKYISGQSAMIDLLTPTYRFFGGWPTAIIVTGHGLAIIAAFLWLIRPLPVLARSVSFALLLGSYYLQAIPPAPWYFPVWNVLSATALGLSAAAWIDAAKNRPWAQSLARCLGAVVLVVQLATVGLVTWQMRQEQSLIDNPVRRAIGEWLAQNGKPDDTVFLEPLGYIGYFSQLHMLDYPGLSAPAVTAAMREVGPNFADLIQKLHPAWLVLRPRELAGHGFKQSTVLNEYEFVKAWDQRATLDSIPFLPGRGWMRVDATFLVYHRRSEESAKTQRRRRRAKAEKRVASLFEALRDPLQS